MKPSPAVDALASLWPLLVLGVSVSALTVASGLLPEGTQLVVTDALIKLTVVIGIYMFVGNSGVLSFGHIAFMGIGAYVAAWLVIPPETKEILLPNLPALLARAHWSPWLGAVAGGVAAAVFAAIVGAPLMRLSGISASIGTFAILAAVNAILSNWTSMTGGQGSLYGLPPFTDRYVALVLALFALVVAWHYRESQYGFRLRASREDEAAAAACGINVRRERLIAFVLGAFFVGAAGSLYAHHLGVIVAREFYLRLSFITLAMLVIGGLRSLAGAVAGVVAVTVLGEGLRHIERGVELGPIALPARPGLQEVGLTALMLVILVFRPHGLTGGREVPVPQRWRRIRPLARGTAVELTSRGDGT